MPSRDFIFVDEHGDPGLPGYGTPHFASIATQADPVGLKHVVESFARLRFYRQAYGEMKALDNNPALRPRLADMLWQLADANGVCFSVTYLSKDRYTGPYLRPHEGIKFRNHQVRRLLEWHFGYVSSSIHHHELVFDRHSHSLGQLDELRSYLSNNYRLPPFAAVTAVDSRYVETIQIADLALRMFRRQRLQANPGWAGLDLSFIRATDVSSSHETGEE